MRAAILGTGHIAGIHAKAIRALGGEIVAVLGRSLASARGFGQGRPYDDLDALLATERPEVVHICTPNHLHAPQAIAAFAAGAHVLCEKPLATSAAEAQAMIAAAEGAGRIGAVCYNYRGYPLIETMRARIASGDCGALRRIGGAYYSEDMCGPDRYVWHLTPGMVGPAFALMDLGVHWFDLAEYVTGRRITEISAQFSTHQKQRQWRGRPGEGPRPPGKPQPDGSVAVTVALEDQADLILRFTDGAAGVVTVSAASIGHPNSLILSLDGQEAGFDWNQQQPDHYAERNGEGLTLRQRRPAEIPGAGVRFLPPGHPEGYFDAFCNVIDACWAAMRGQPSRPWPGFADGLRGLQLVEAAVASAGTRRPVTLA